MHAVGSYPAAMVFRDVGAEIRREHPGPGTIHPDLFHQVACAGSSNGDLHVITAASGKLFHTIRLAGGSWSEFGDVVTEISVREHPGSKAPQQIGAIGCAMVSDELHVACVDGSGIVWHTIRRAERTWYPFGNVLDVVHGDNPGSRLSLPMASIAVADSF
jgi:hypothetical protein